VEEKGRIPELFALRQFRMHTGNVAAHTNQTRCRLRDCGMDRRTNAALQAESTLDARFARA
jgi:hypothetical protein